MNRTRCVAFLPLGMLLTAAHAAAQPPQGPGAPPGPPPGPRELLLKERFDADKNGVLDADERARARAAARERPRPRMGRRGPPGGPGRPGDGAARAGEQREPVRVSPDDVTHHPDAPLYDPAVLRTVFLEFPQEDWFEECADFYRTDVEVPARMVVDGREYRDVGVSFRGNSSFFAVAGRKKSFGISVDAVQRDQRLYGYRTLNLLNAHSDPSYLREVVHAFIARRWSPAAQANLVHLVVNGESFGVYANVQQINKDFLAEEYGTRKGTRWKVPADFRGPGLAWRGEDRAAYEGSYELKGTDGDEDAAWRRLIELCRVLCETELARLPEELPRVLDVDAAQRFLALDSVLLDGDGYLSRGSDFMLWEGPDGRFRPIPYDSNEILGGGGMPGGRRGPEPGRDGPERGRGPGLRGPGGPMRAPSPTSSPLALLETDRPLARLLQVPQWRARYLALVRGMARDGLDWAVLGPFVEELHERIAPLVRADEKSLHPPEAFAGSIAALRRVVETRRAAVLEHESLQLAWPTLGEPECAVVPDGDRARVAVRVTAGDAASVVLYVSASRSEPYEAVPMFDDGAHDDGDAGDGVFGATSGALPRKGRAFWWIEATSADGNAVTLSPPAGSGRPQAVTLTAR